MMDLAADLPDRSLSARDHNQEKFLTHRMSRQIFLRRLVFSLSSPAVDHRDARALTGYARRNENFVLVVGARRRLALAEQVLMRMPLAATPGHLVESSETNQGR